MNMSLGLGLLNEVDNIEDPVLRIIEKFKKHPSLVAIFENYKDSTFHFRHVSLDEITKELNRLDEKKACQKSNFVTKVNKNNSDIFADFFSFNLNNYIALSVFPSNFKNAEMTPVHKKD